MSSVARKQDLPPPGGFARIQYERNPGRKFLNSPILIAGYIASTAIGIYLICEARRQDIRNRTEQKSGSNAIQPFLFAERDRAYLKQVRKNFEAEAELMKNVPGWQVGTYYGRRVYTTRKDDEWTDPIFYEFYAHASPEDMMERRDYSTHL